MRIQPNRALLNGLVVGIVLLMVAGVAGAVVKPGAEKVRAGDKSEAAADKSRHTKDGSASSSSAPATTATPTTAAPSKSTAKPGATGTQTTPAGPPNPASTWTPPKDGTYQYTTEGQDGTQDLTIKTTDRSGGEVRQRTSGSFNQGSGSLDQVWNNQGFFWERISGGDGTQSGSCDFQPPLRILAQPMAAGTAWNFDSRCTIQFGAQSVVIHISGSAKVIKADRVSVAGTLVDTWLIERTSTNEIIYGGQTKSTNTSKSSEEWAPAYGLDTQSTQTDDKGESHKRSLVSLQPK